ncbi:hypothetical protein AU08_0224280 [Escherichia coli E1140]|nr:hypothetical protein AU08_0224280 [Escherichia coli E1140]
MLQLLIDMSEAVEPAVPDEEVLLEVFHHPLNLTFCSGPAWTACPWQEVIVVGQQQESGVEHDFPVVPVEWSKAINIPLLNKKFSHDIKK